MSLNLLDLLKGQIGGQLIKQASGFLGEDESKTQSAMDSILPSLLGGVMSKASTKSGAGALLDMLGSGGHDGSIFSNLSGLMGGGDATTGLVKSGGGIMSSLFGDKVGGLVSLISNVSGMGNNSSSSLLSMAAPLVMGMLGKQTKSMGLGASGLASMLMGQKDHIKGALPDGFGDALGIGSLDNVVGSAEKEWGSLLTPITDLGKKVVGTTTETVSKAAGATVDTGKKVVSGAADVATDAAKTGGSILRWLLPLLLVLAIGAWLLSKAGCQNEAVDAVNNTTSGVIDKTKGAAGAVVDKTAEAAGAVAGAAGDVAKGAANLAKEGLNKVTLAGGEAIDFVKGSFGDKFANYVIGKDKTLGKVFTFDNVTFNTGSDILTATSNIELDNLAKVLKAYPNVHIRLEGHTDNTGDASKNLKLSQSRADAVKTYLMNKGIAEARLTSKGYGSTKPVAKNTTEEGKKQNRRTDAVITKK